MSGRYDFLESSELKFNALKSVSRESMESTRLGEGGGGRTGLTVSSVSNDGDGRRDPDSLSSVAKVGSDAWRLWFGFLAFFLPDFFPGLGVGSGDFGGLGPSGVASSSFFTLRLIPALSRFLTPSIFSIQDMILQIFWSKFLKICQFTCSTFLFLHQKSVNILIFFGKNLTRINNGLSGGCHGTCHGLRFFPMFPGGCGFGCGDFFVLTYRVISVVIFFRFLLSFPFFLFWLWTDSIYKYVNKFRCFLKIFDKLPLRWSLTFCFRFVFLHKKSVNILIFRR